MVTSGTHGVSVGAIVDDAIALYRSHWRLFLSLAVVWTVVNYVVFYAEYAGPVSRALGDPNVWSEPQKGLGGFWDFIKSAVSLLVGVLLSGAITAATLGVMAGRLATVGNASMAALNRFGALVFTSVIWLLRLIGLWLLSMVLLPLAVIGLGGLVPLVLLLVWWRSPRSRGSTLKWVTILLTPFGLPIYWYVNWGLWGALVFIEGQSGGAVLGRSVELVRPRWFTAAGVTAVTTLVGMVLALAPLLLVRTVLGFVGITGGFNDTRLITLTVGLLAGAPLAIVAAPIFPIALTLLTLGLRNEREGTDLEARLEVLAAAAS